MTFSDPKTAPIGHQPRAMPNQVGVEEKTLRCEKLQIERKLFTLSLRENPRGRFLRITEDVAGWHDNVIVPASGLDDFASALAAMAKTAAAAELLSTSVEAMPSGEASAVTNA